MKYQVKVSAFAQFDIASIYEYYNHQKVGLGLEFINELDEKLNYLSKEAQTIQLRFNNIRISHLDRFPYSIHFKITGKEVLVIGVYGMKENPNKWRITS